MAASEAVLNLLLTVSGLGITCLNAHDRLSLLTPMLCVGCAWYLARTKAPSAIATAAAPPSAILLKERNRR
jgi:hypothetical protein